MKYGLIIEDSALVAIASMPETGGELFTPACFDVSADPHGLNGVTDTQAGHLTTRTWAVGALGFIVYDVDEQAAVVTITRIISLL